VVKSGVNTLVWAGDADRVCDWMGNLAVADAVAYPDIHVFKHKEVKNYTVNGVVAGTYKTESLLNWLRVFESGHSVSYYRKLGVRRGSTGLTESTFIEPELALQVFKQVMEGRPIHST
jgi:carboxypeptidase D